MLVCGDVVVAAAFDYVETLLFWRVELKSEGVKAC
jgi:hypothetical protein